MKEYLVYSGLIVLLSCLTVANSQLGPPPSLSIPGALPIPVRQPLQYRNERLVNGGGPNAGFVRIRRPVLASAAPATLQSLQAHNAIEEAKPVTEESESGETPSFIPQHHLLPQPQAQILPKQLPAVLYSYDENGEDLSQHRHIDLATTPRFIQHQTPEPVIPTTIRTSPNSQRFSLNQERAQNIHQSLPKPALRNHARPDYREPRPQFEEDAPQPVRRPHHESYQAKPKQHHPNEHDEREKKPVAQILRKYREENEDGTITWGFENDDGSYKEEIIGNDCITRGRYGYVDPDGLKREYTYETGIQCDPNKRDLEEQEEEDVNNENGATLQDNGAYVDYQENTMVLPNGKRINLSNVGKNKARRPNGNYPN